MTKILSYYFSLLFEREGNWAELAFALTSGIATDLGLSVSYWPIFSLFPLTVPAVFAKVKSAQFPSHF